MPDRIDMIHAWVSTDEDGNEGITAFRDPASGFWMPMVAADQDRLDSLREMAQQIATASGRSVTRIRLSLRDDVEVLQP